MRQPDGVGLRHAVQRPLGGAVEQEHRPPGVSRTSIVSWLTTNTSASMSRSCESTNRSPGCGLPASPAPGDAAGQSRPGSVRLRGRSSGGDHAASAGRVRRRGSRRLRGEEHVGGDQSAPPAARRRPPGPAPGASGSVPRRSAPPPAHASTAASAAGRVEVVGEVGAQAQDQVGGGRAGVERHGRAPAGEPLLRRGEQLGGPLAVAAVVPGQQRQPDRVRVDVLGAQLRDEHQVAARLGHLRAVEADHAGVRVVPGEGVHAGERLGVRGAALVVREDQVGAAAVEVDLRAEPVERDRRALDVPAGPAGAELRLPATARPSRAMRHSSGSSGCALAGPVGVAAALGGRSSSIVASS